MKKPSEPKKNLIVSSELFLATCAWMTEESEATGIIMSSTKRHAWATLWVSPPNQWNGRFYVPEFTHTGSNWVSEDESLLKVLGTSQKQLTSLTGYDGWLKKKYIKNRDIIFELLD